MAPVFASSDSEFYWLHETIDFQTNKVSESTLGFAKKKNRQVRNVYICFYKTICKEPEVLFITFSLSFTWKILLWSKNKKKTKKKEIFMLRLCSSGCFCEHTWVKPFTVIFNFSLLLSLFQAHSRCLLAVSLTDAQKNTWQETVWRI